MSSLDTLFSKRLREWLLKTENNAVRQMRSGALDFESYKRQSGYLAALEHVNEQCDQIEQDISEGK